MVYASLFGVGAPEALVIGVVALLVFGPKGLAEVSGMLLMAKILVSYCFCENAWMSFCDILGIAGFSYSLNA